MGCVRDLGERVYAEVSALATSFYIYTRESQLHIFSDPIRPNSWYEAPRRIIGRRFIIWNVRCLGSNS